jgi:mono/diheme cytochrome c family protein
MATHRWIAALAAGVLLAALTSRASAQGPSEEAYDYFARNCTSCHTIGGGRLVGPDLKDVLARRDRDWLVRFIQDPKAVIDSGDAYAQSLFRDAKGVYMPTPPNVSSELAGKLLDVIEAESGLEKSRFAGLQISDRPLTVEDTALGRRLFRGETAFASGAPACFSCHTLAGAGGFGGGQLGPDLTTVYARLEGRKALAAWLSAPPSAMMAPIFRKTPLSGDEVLALTAYLKHTSASGESQAGSGALAFMLSGFGLAAVLLVLFDVVWAGRYRATRKPLVEGRTGRRRIAEGRTS